MKCCCECRCPCSERVRLVHVRFVGSERSFDHPNGPYTYRDAHGDLERGELVRAGVHDGLALVDRVEWRDAALGVPGIAYRAGVA